MIAKPIGPICNLRCAYCFYLGKESLYPAGESWRMSDETLDAYVRQYLDAQPPSVDEVDFAFQGGEPTLMGLDFFRRVVELQAVHARPGVRSTIRFRPTACCWMTPGASFSRSTGFSSAFRSTGRPSCTTSSASIAPARGRSTG